MNPTLSAYAATQTSLAGRLETARSGLSDAASAGRVSPERASRARETAREFETMMLEEMLGRVFESVGEVGLFGEAGPGAGMYQSMLVKEYAGKIAERGGLGLADGVYAEILKLQEGA
ncbi:rod-binding protein [Salinarimonas chemoclinalis]|uniref:rod-binding protein n=1 Tax=Salinarimonas chemoclinalis TaxID=3241599 RepID=UPI00355626CC